MKLAGLPQGRLILALCLMAVALPLPGEGRGDDHLLRADALIAGRRYDDAILTLAGQAGENPDQFYRAQKRFRKIMTIRSRYDTLVGELLDVVVADRDNSEKMLDLIRRLEELESARGVTLQFIARVEELAFMGQNRQILERIMAEARSLLDRGDFVAAMGRYQRGLELYRDALAAMGYGESIAGLARSIEDCAAQAPLFYNALAGIGQVSAAGGEGGLAMLREWYARLVLPIERLVAANNAMAETARYFEEQLVRFRQEDSDIEDRNCLAFASRIIRGREDADIQEGLLGAAAGLWASALAPFEAALQTAAEGAYRNACALQESRNFPQAREQFDLAIACCALARDFIEDWRHFYRGQDVPASTYFDDTVVVFKAEEYLRYSSLRLASASLKELGALAEQRDRLMTLHSTALESWQQGVVDTETALAMESLARDSYHDLSRSVNDALMRLNSDGAILLELQRDLAGEEGRFAPVETAQALFAGMDADIFVLENSSAIREYAIGNGDLQRRALEWKSRFAEANRFFAGLSPSAPEEDGGPRRPAEAFALFGQIEQGSVRWLEDARSLVALYEKEPPRFFREPRIAALYNAARSMTREIEDIRTASLALERTARAEASQAETFKLDGDRLYREAQAALARNDFDTARNRALRAGERYDASLAIQESPALRSARDTSLVALGAEIIRLEHETLVREVRGLVNTARDSYFQGDLIVAEEALVRAVNRWRRSGAEDDPEVAYWLTVVRGALLLRADRVILPTAPLYAEMSQLLSEAGKNYRQGMALINEDRREEGLERFAEARRKTRELRLMFPLNQEARLLELRMDQVADPAAFNASFRRRLDEAVSGAREGSAESFAELQNLSQINPGYPGIRGMVVQAEIDIGYRPAPPEPRSLARSAELAATARGIVDRNLRSQFPVALELLNQALALNPVNTQAMSLKDYVQTELGGGGSVVLSSAAEKEYRRAVQALQQGNALVAMTIVRQLLSDERNRNSRRILDLQKRIESAL
jgi:hypothetical protein